MCFCTIFASRLIVGSVFVVLWGSVRDPGLNFVPLIGFLCGSGTLGIIEVSIQVCEKGSVKRTPGSHWIAWFLVVVNQQRCRVVVPCTVDRCTQVYFQEVFPSVCCLIVSIETGRNRPGYKFGMRLRPLALQFSFFSWVNPRMRTSMILFLLQECWQANYPCHYPFVQRSYFRK